MIKFLLFSLSFSHFFSLLACQTLRSYLGRHGTWQLLHESVGISAMHMQLLHNNKVVIFDRTDFGRSNLSLPSGHCRSDPFDTVLKTDCTAHSILYDIATNSFRPLMVQTDTWCSSGAVLSNGTLLQTGGFNDGDRKIRTFTPCNDENCDWIELPQSLSQRRWYATNQILPDGRVIVVGGRGQFNYEFLDPQEIEVSSNGNIFWLDFLKETNDHRMENNLYPFLHLLPDGNLFIFANTRSILLNFNQNRVVKEFPPIPGGDPRNYPSSGSSVLLPLDDQNDSSMEPEVMVCGGAPNGSFLEAMQGNFVRAISTCGRLKVFHANPSWEMENMPVPRVMGDMSLLPNGDVLIINGAESGTAGWELGRDPVTRPIIYRAGSGNPPNWRFLVLSPSIRPRMYHSSAILLHDGRVLVGGSNPHVFYNFTSEFPTDLSIETFSPPYLSQENDPIRPRILFLDEKIGYGKAFSLCFGVRVYLTANVLSVRIVAPSFSTHSFAMNQRMVVLKITDMTRVVSAPPHTFMLSIVGPSAPEIAPPGYYLLFVVHDDIPSSGMWVKIE